ncbi:MAG: hypothetical protein AYK22_08135 [Thermoplasmatales archaeon SG8-52-3]|nr:MAG: hypothetical protein AYK22_08135 [Thermoplasmatales archaeon SG8-52-3]
MKKIFYIILVGVLVFSGIQVTAFNDINKIDSIEINKSFIFSQPKIKSEDNYISIEFDEMTGVFRDPGKPEIPMVNFNFELPFGAKNIEIFYSPSSEYQLDILQKIKPTPPAVTPSCGEQSSCVLVEDAAIYSSINRYPSNWYDFKITCGLNIEGKLKTHVSIYQFPVQYSPSNNKIYYIDSAEVKITFEPPAKKLSYEEEYDLVIIAPKRFSSGLQKLIDHKNNNNIRTYLKTTDEIYDEFSGFDKPEQIKKFIQHAKEVNNVTYVLLVGGLKRYIYAKDRDDPNQGTKAWHLPVRYTNIMKGGLQDNGCISDLYYADLYKEGGEFEDWDSDGDGVLAVWGSDVLDLRPDIIVTRLPCRNLLELKIIIPKIIKYESSTPTTDDWYKRMVGIAGLNHGFHLDQPDAEYLADLAFGYMESLIDEEVRVYASNNDTGGPIPVTKDIIKAFKNGARYIYMPGHGSPVSWNCHPVEGVATWMGGIRAYKFWRFFNSGKLPVVVVGGCHCAQFNITLLNTLNSPNLNDNHWYWTGGMPGSSCLNWKMLLIPWGGAIASVGGTGLTTSYSGTPNTLNSLLATNTFYMIGQEGVDTFGEAFTGSQIKFIDENPVTNVLQAHAYTIWNAFGDPSLNIE